MIQRQAFPVTLVFPPQGHFTQPYLALPCLKAWLVAHGIDDVELVDANIEAYDHFLSREYLERARARCEQRLSLAGYEQRTELPFRELPAFRAAAESAVSADALIAGIEEAKDTVRGPAFFELERYVGATRTIYHALRLVSAAHHPSQLTPHNFTMGHANDRSAEVLAATRDEEQNPFIAYFRDELLPSLVRRKPRVVGMSVIYGSQLIPALTLGRMIKEALPDCHVTAGGGFLAYIGAKLIRASGMEQCLDSIIFHEGEAPLLALCEALRDGKPLDAIGSLSWYARARTSAARAQRTNVRDAEAFVENPPGHPIKLDEAPVPDFDGLPFELYFSPEIVIPYDINRGCYYGECTFCTLPTVIGPGYRTRSARTIVDQTLALCARHGTRNVNFITDCMPPGMIRDLPGELIERKADIRWWCDARVEPKAYTREGAELLYQAGCRKLLFGFESATPRILKMMKKGQSLKSTLDVARNCTAAGISVTFYAMVGFPTETRAEAQATLDFILDNKDVVREVSLQTFHIDEVAQTYHEPATFGIRILSDPEADLQLYHDYELVSSDASGAASGMTQAEAAQMFESMLAGFRRELPIFAGDNIFYFMQKSHYFLHLARDVHPDEFNARCRARLQRERGAVDRAATARDGLVCIELPFSYGETLEKLADPLARAIRPDFLTGCFVAGAQQAAEQQLGALAPKRRVLVYSGAGEFVELRPDGERVLDALRRAGSLGALLDGLDAHDERARAKLGEFAAELQRLDLLSTPAHARTRSPSLASLDARRRPR